MPIGELKMAEYNPRRIAPENFERLRKSLREFGFADPAVVNKHVGRENVVIGGHMRIRAAEQEGMTEVPCFFVDMDESREKLLNIALNAPALQGVWDEERLAEILVKLNEDGADLTLTGFNEDELRVHLGLGEAKGQGQDPERFEVLTILPPESPKLRERAQIHCDTIEQYEKIKKAVAKGDIGLHTLLQAAGEKTA